MSGKLSVFEIYSEGYVATGNRGTATFHGTAEGITFKEACINFANANSNFKEYFNEANMTYWGCSLHSRCDEASKSFG